MAAFTERPGATVLEQHQHFIISWLENAVRTGALEGLADDEEAKIYVTLDNGDEGESLTPELDSERTSDTRTSTRSGSDTRSTASRTLQAQQPLDSSTNKRSEVRIPRHTRFLHRMNRVLAITPKGFFDAVMQGNLERVEELLTDPGLDINCRGDCRITALHLAAYEGYRDLAKIILDKGAKTEAKDERGQTALHFAARRDHLDLVEILLANGADIEASTDDGETALYTAAWYGHSEVVEFLLTRGANIRTRDHNGWTPLHRAAYGGHAMVIEILLNRGAVIEARIIDGVTALLFAAPRGNLKAVEMLLRQEANANAKTNTGYTSLHQASLRGDTNMVKLLLSSKKVKVDANTNSGKTALFVAASNNHLIDAKSVQHAISHGNVDILTLLLNRGTDRNISNDNRSTPLDETMNGK